MIRHLEVDSKALHGFPMGDPSRRELTVYLPPGYDSDSKKRYPVIFWLAGWSSRGSYALREESVFQRPLDKRMDDQIAAKTMPPLIVAFVDGASKLGCSQYINSPSLGNYSDHICDELVSLVDKNFRTIPDPEFRGIAGHSSGGFGAMINGMHRPDVFQFVCSSAGDSFFEANLPPSIYLTVGVLEKMGGVSSFIETFLREPHQFRGGTKEFEAMLVLSSAPCYAPRPQKPSLFGELFFDLKTGEIIEEIWKEYLAWDPVRRLDSFSSQAQKLKYVLLEAGADDEHGLQMGHRQFASKLKRLKISHDLIEYPGGHSGHSWRNESRFRRLLEHMDLRAA